MRTLVYAAVPADQVVEGDLYANGGTVTESRPADAEDCKHLSEHVDGYWHIRCGEGFSVTTKRPIVVGRPA